MNNLQAEHKEWVDRMFPGQKPWLPAACCVEEAGELLHCIIKIDQSKAWGCEPRYQTADWDAKLKDAVGDCAISACSLCNANGWSFDDAMCETEFNSSGHTTLLLVAELIQTAAKMAINPSVRLYLVTYLAILRAIARELGLSFAVAVKETWEEVRTRDRHTKA